MWECGLKPLSEPVDSEQYEVTPYVGVWIETAKGGLTELMLSSLLMWECGLKRKDG